MIFRIGNGAIMQIEDYKREDIFNSPLVAIDIETTGLTRRDEIVSAAVTWTNERYELMSKAFYLDRCAQEDIQKDDDEFQKILHATLFNNCKKSNPQIRINNGSAIFINNSQTL